MKAHTPSREEKIDHCSEKQNFPKAKLPKQRPIYVVQLHNARSLHYDFRLEVNGALVSFAVPKGPSLNPLHKRLAIRTPDHALSYALFEGIIPEGKYGAGGVMVWDVGTFHPLKTRDGKPISPEKSLDDGLFEFFVEGQKLYGAFALIRLDKTPHNQWLLVKMKDEFVNRNSDSIKLHKRSVLTGRTLKQIESCNDKTTKNKKDRKKVTR
jgi:DNA ligase D-like protein (predicted 3'-phosphoesterase)